MSSDYSSDDENRTNIFEPTLDNFENTQHYIGKPNSSGNENDCELIENPLYSSKIEPNDNQEVFIANETPPAVNLPKTPTNIGKVNPFNSERAPEIQIETEGSGKPAPPNSLMLSQKLSHSSNDVNYGESDGVNYHVRSNSQHEIVLNIASSHSESALRHLNYISSPVSSTSTSTTKDLVLSPLTKLAKGVQNLGANLDPRKIKGSAAVKHVTEQQYVEHRKLQEKWRDCNTRLVGL